jgi:general secretion pathway protein L
MRVRVFVPATDRFESARFALLDGRGNVLREGTAPLAEIPRADAAEVILPVTRVLFARLALPRVNAATIRELLPFAVEDRLLGDPAHIHAVAGNRGANGETTVAIVDRDWFARTLDALRHAGLKPRSAWSESALAPRGEGVWNLAWGPQTGILVDDRDVAVAFDRGDGDELPLALRLALDEAAARGERPRAICVRSEAGEPLPELERWSADSGVMFMKSEPWEWVRLRAPQAEIDLLQGEFAQRSASLSARRIPRAAAILAGVIAVLQLAFVAADAWRLERERRSLEARREAIFRTAFPEAKAVVDPVLQMRRNLAELRRTRGLASDDDFLAQLTRAAREGATPVRAIEYASGRLQVRREATAMGTSR